MAEGSDALLGVAETLKMLLLLLALPPKIGVVATPTVGFIPNMLVLLLARLPKAGVALEALPNVEAVLPKILLPVVLLFPKMEPAELAEGLLNRLVLVLELPNSPPVVVLKILNGAVVDDAVPVEVATIFITEKEKGLVTLVSPLLAPFTLVGVMGLDSPVPPFVGVTVLSNLEGFSNKSLKVSVFVGWVGVKLNEACSFGVPNFESPVDGVTLEEGVPNIVALLLLSF